MHKRGHWPDQQPGLGGDAAGADVRPSRSGVEGVSTVAWPSPSSQQGDGGRKRDESRRGWGRVVVVARKRERWRRGEEVGASQPRARQGGTAAAQSERRGKGAGGRSSSAAAAVGEE